MPTVSVSTLIDRAKATADMRDNFVTPTQWQQWASQERLALDFFLARSGWALPLSDFDITVAGDEGGDFDVNPATGVMAIVCVYEYDTAGRVRMLRQQDAYSFVKRTHNYVGHTGDSKFYRVQWAGDSLTLNLYPTPSAGETYRVVYIAHPASLYLSSNSFAATGTFGEITLYLPDLAGEGMVFNVVPSGQAGTTVTMLNEDLGLLTTTYEYDVSATYQDLADAINASSALITAEVTGDGTTRISLTNQYFQPAATLTGATHGATSVAYPLGWEERIVLGMARRALMKEESETRAVDAEIMLWESRIEEACWNRVLSNSPSVRNSDQEVYGWTDRFSMPPIGNWVFP